MTFKVPDRNDAAEALRAFFMLQGAPRINMTLAELCGTEGVSPVRERQNIKIPEWR